MSSIERMSIQGIRSFGVDDKDRQVIQFFAPLTLILGPNGTGKTTIIECLKYMTTGDMPPGCTKGGAFIHDPKIAHERQVKGQIRLQFKDRAGKKVVVQRSLEATQKLKKVEVRTLEGMITRLGRDGQKHSISSRCAEIDREMITSLGVSKAILENVIFCHQEDSCWPLSEGKVLKQKFDDIFASTRYTKVLDNIRKISKDQTTEIKLIEKDLSYLRQNKEKATQLRSDLAETEARYVASSETVEKIKEKLEPIQVRLDQLGSRYDEIVKIQTKIEKLAGEKKQMEKTAQELQNSIRNEFEGSTEDLRQHLEDFQDEVQEKNGKLKKYERKLDAVKNEIEKMSEEKSKVLLQQGKLEEESKRNDQNLKKRERKIQELAEENNIEGFSRTTSDEDVKIFFIEMKQKAEKILEDAKSVRVQYERKEEDIQKQIDELRSTKSKLEENEKLKTDMMTKNKSEIRGINQELSRVDASSERLEGLSRELLRVSKDLQEAEESMNVEEMKAEVTDLQKEKVTLDSRVSVLSSEMSKMHMESTARAQLEMLQKEKTTKEEQIRKIKSRHEDSLSHLLGHVPSEGMKRKLDDYIREQSSSVQRARSELQQLKVDFSKREENRKNILEQLQKKEKELSTQEEKIYDVCGESQDFDEGIEKLKDKIDQEQDKRGSYYGAKYFLEKYLRRLNEDSPPCPLCHRLFESQDEVEELISEIKNNLNLVPSKLETAEKNLNQFRVKYDKMQQMKPVRTSIKDLADKEIPDFKKKLRTVNEEIDGLRCLVSEKEEELESQQGDETMAKQIQPDIVMLDRYQVELRDCERKISVQSSKLSGGDSKRTMQQVNKEKEEAQLNLDMLNRKLEGKRQQMSDHTERVHQLHSSVNELTSEKLRIENDLQQRIRLEETKAELLNANKEYEGQIKEAREQIQPLKTEMEKLRQKRDNVTAEKEEHYEDEKNKYDALREKGRDIMRVHSEIEKYIREGRGQALQDTQSKIKHIEDKVGDLVNEDTEFSTNIDKIRKELAAQQVRERELSDNLQLRKKQEEVGEISAQISEMKDKLEGFDVTNLQREMRKLQTKHDEFMKEKHTAAGRQSTLEEEIKRYRRELQDNMFKNAESEYQDKMIVKRTTEMANSDLDKYYKALDRTIFQYHSQKMSEINKMIRELWRNTYKGNDIETIEIRSDEDEGASGATKTRRVYNYRVVMLKSDTVIDMRGRCSAGQKVLASLIIRLALAEAFCVNCGILALDEPTTNLDRENIESLAYALVEIIKSRAGQMNFQLVVITHDEDFVELLGRSDFVEEFFKVRKDQFGLSQLVKAKVQDLHSR